MTRLLEARFALVPLAILAGLAVVVVIAAIRVFYDWIFGHDYKEVKHHGDE